MESAVATKSPEATERPSELQHESTHGLVWESVEGVSPAAWVGRVHGSFVGLVEARWQEGFIATTRLGRKLGTFGTLEDAEDAFVVRPALRR